MASEAKDKVDAAARVAAANAPGKPTGVALYSRFALAGAVCCAVTHGALTPVDVYVLLLFDIQIYNLFFFLILFPLAKSCRPIISTPQLKSPRCRHEIDSLQESTA